MDVYCNAGCDYINVIFQKYATLLQVVCITMLYGIAMPMLFPIAGMYVIMHYIFERISLVYIYQAPPQMNMLLSIEVIRIL